MTLIHSGDSDSRYNSATIACKRNMHDPDLITGFPIKTNDENTLVFGDH